MSKKLKVVAIVIISVALLEILIGPMHRLSHWLEEMRFREFQRVVHRAWEINRKTVNYESTQNTTLPDSLDRLLASKIIDESDLKFLREHSVRYHPKAESLGDMPDVRFELFFEERNGRRMLCYTDGSASTYDDDLAGYESLSLTNFRNANLEDFGIHEKYKTRTNQ